MIRVLNYIGIVFIAVAVISIINDLNFTFSIEIAIFGIVLTLPDSILFHKTMKGKDPRFTSYWIVKLIGYLFGLSILTIILIIQVKGK